MISKSIFDLNLKLPRTQMLVFGEEITSEKAEEIIRRNDLAIIQDFEPKSSKIDRNFNREFKKILKKPVESVFNIEGEIATSSWHKSWGSIFTKSIFNSWFNSQHLLGPCGWCHPNGKIEFHHNLNKDSTIESVYSDWVEISENFKFLNLKSILMSGEEGDLDSSPILGFLIQEGKVEVIKDPIDLDFYFKEYYRLNSNSEHIISGSYNSKCYFSIEKCKSWLAPFLKI